MRILAIETATSLGSVALLQDSETVAVISEFVPRRHLEWLAPALQRLLGSAGWAVAQVEAVAVSTGPRAFTSLRIRISPPPAVGPGGGVPPARGPQLAAGA